MKTLYYIINRYSELIKITKLFPILNWDQPVLSIYNLLPQKDVSIISFFIYSSPKIKINLSSSKHLSKLTFFYFHFLKDH